MPELIDAVGRSFATKPAAPQRLVVADEGQDWVVMPGLRWGGGLLCKVLRVGHGQPSAEGSTIEGLVIVLDENGRPRDDPRRRNVDRQENGGGRRLRDEPARPPGRVRARAVRRRLARRGASSRRWPPSGRWPRCVSSDARRSGSRPFASSSATWGGTSRPRMRAPPSGAPTSSSPPRPRRLPSSTTPTSRPGTHIDAIGSYRPERAEVPAATVASAVVVVETREAAWHEAGDLIQPREAGLIDEAHVYAELHEREKLEAVRERDPDAVTLFKSVGHVALDLAAVETARSLSSDRSCGRRPRGELAGEVARRPVPRPVLDERRILLARTPRGRARPGSAT